MMFAPAIFPAAFTLPTFDPSRVVDFWLDAGPDRWFAKDPRFDDRFRKRFADLYSMARDGQLGWRERTATGALGVVLLLDQYPRNAFRGRPEMYATDDLARAAADRAIRAGHDQKVEEALRIFFYLPFAHSETIADQDRSVALCAALGPKPQARAEHHRDIILRFGRFPHRNPILGRDMRPEEQAYLDGGGYAG